VRGGEWAHSGLRGGGSEGVRGGEGGRGGGGGGGGGSRRAALIVPLHIDTDAVSDCKDPGNVVRAVMVLAPCFDCAASSPLALSPTSNTTKIASSLISAQLLFRQADSTWTWRDALVKVQQNVIVETVVYWP